jgi:hypothetical protein
VSITLTGRTTAYNILKISSACFAMRKVTPLTKTDTSNLVHFAHFHAAPSSRLLFWGNSTGSYKLLNTLKKISKRMAGVSIFCLPKLVMENLENFQTNTDAHNLHITLIY